jgi:hypothetical protein
MMWGWCGRAPRARQPVARAAKSRIRAEATGHIPTIRSGPPAPIDGALQHDRGAGIDSIPGHPVGDQEHAAADRRLSCACGFGVTSCTRPRPPDNTPPRVRQTAGPYRTGIGSSCSAGNSPIHSATPWATRLRACSSVTMCGLLRAASSSPIVSTVGLRFEL